MHDREELSEINKLRKELLEDFFLFHRIVFKKRTGRDFIISKPDGNESHFYEVCRELTNVFLLKTNRLSINLPPGWAKSELCKSFICWCFAHYPDCKFLYISHSYELAALHTSSIKQTMSMGIYRELFNVEIRRDSSAKDHFQTTNGGEVKAFGSQGGITGFDAGLPGEDRFTGGVVIDDIHKPEEIHSDGIRERIQRNYFETIERRPRAPNVPIILIGQRLHEDDLFAHLMSGADGKEWRNIIIKALDDAGNARYPEVNPKSQLLTMKEKQPYVFASQYQQDPMPAGGGLFQRAWFPILDECPKIITTFITCDTAETEKEYNDATVFSFWGIYQLTCNGSSIDDMYALHWIDCAEMRIEPKDLQNTLLDFWTGCMRYKVKPKFVAIEKKSTGVTLLSALKDIQGLRILDVERNGTANSKTNRFIEMQQYIANKQVSLPYGAKHTSMCIEHMSKITANNVHRFDDIADTCYDAVKIALIDKILINKEVNAVNYDNVAKNLMSGFHKVNRLKQTAYVR